MEMKLRHRIAGGALALSLLAGSGAAVAAQDTDQGQAGGAAGLVNAIVQAQLDDTVNVEVVDSLNNLRALNNVLNYSPILSGFDVTVGDVSVLDDTDIDVDALGISVEDIVAVLEVGEDFIILV